MDRIKEISIVFPFEVWRVRTLSMRCTGIEPYCQNYESERYRISICHKYILPRDNRVYTLAKSEKELKNSVEEFVEYSLGDKRKYYEESSEFAFIPIEIFKNDIGETYSFGYTQKAGIYKRFEFQHYSVTQSEYMDIEIETFLEKKDIHVDLSEINYMLNNIIGMPMIVPGVE